MLYIVARNHCMQFQWKLMYQTWKMTNILVSDPILGFLAQIWTKKFFSWILHQLDVMNYCKLSLYWTSRKTNENKVEKIAKNLVSGPILARFGLNSLHPPKNIFVGFTSTKCYALLQAIVERNFKEN